MFRNAGPTTTGAAGGAERSTEARVIGHLETLRGLAFVLLVVCLAIGNDPSRGVRAEPRHPAVAT